LYFIRPNSDLDPFKVYCRFDSDFGFTVLQHDSPSFKSTSNPGQSNECAEKGCYHHVINYTNTMDQILAVIEISAACSQSVVNNCTNSQLSGFSWWEDRNRNNISYWDGSFDQSATGCSCFLSEDGCQSRTDEENICNCDSFGQGVEDRGVLTNKNQLPVKSLSYGDDVGTLSFIRFKLGFLECSGKEVGVVYPAEQKDHRRDQFIILSEDFKTLEQNTMIVENQVALMRGMKLEKTSDKSGLLLVEHNGQWGTVCDDLFTMREAHTACRALGYKTAIGYTSGSTSTYPIMLHDVQCDENSTSSLTVCKHSGFYVHDCTHDEDINLTCE